MLFFAMLRIRNESRWIAQVIESISGLCERVFILDDHSTDNTVEICETFDNVTLYRSPFEGLDESRDKTWMYEKIRQVATPDWMLCIDGDEVLDTGGAEAIKHSIETEPCQAYGLKIVYLWDDPKRARVDRVYGNFYRPSLFSPKWPGLNEEIQWLSTPFGRLREGNKPNLHCSSVPQAFLHAHEKCPARLLHYGYMDRADRVRKLDYYNSIDWQNEAEDSYRHVCQGDSVHFHELPLCQKLKNKGYINDVDLRFMTDAPAWAHLMHAGPMEFEILQEPTPVLAANDSADVRSAATELTR